MSRDELADILTPWFLEQLSKSRFPWPSNVTTWEELVEGQKKASEELEKSPERQEVRDNLKKLELAALKIISKTPVEKVHAHNLMKYLPSPSSPDFLEQSMGLQFLLDQSPRGLKGRDERYVHSYFGIVAEHLSDHLLELPEGQRPDSIKRWMDIGCSYTEGVRRCIWYIVPLIHSENLKNHEYGVTEWPEGSITIAKVALEGPPQDEWATMEQHLFWFMHLIDVHIPIIRTFGRYPYRNNIDGRIDTEEEKDFMKQSENFGKEDISKEDEEAIRKDVVDGIWSPLEGTGFGKD